SAMDAQSIWTLRDQIIHRLAVAGPDETVTVHCYNFAVAFGLYWTLTPEQKARCNFSWFRWHPGDEVLFSGKRYTLIDQTFTGPCPIWLACETGAVEWATKLWLGLIGDADLPEAPVRLLVEANLQVAPPRERVSRGGPDI